MSRKRYYTILSVGLFVMISFFIIFRLINQSIENQLAIQLQKIKKELSQKDPVQIPIQNTKKQKRPLSPSDLTSYQIIPHRKSRLFKNQQYWNVMTRNALQQSGIIDNIQTEGIFKGIEKTPEQFKKQIRQIDGRIRKYKQKIRNNPNDEHAKQKLQNLYMIKSTVKALKETIVSSNR